MALTSGTRLGPYEILAAIGAGGMGEPPPYAPGTDFWFQVVHLDFAGGPPFPVSNLQACHFFF